MSETIHMHLRRRLGPTAPTLIRLPVLEPWSDPPEGELVAPEKRDVQEQNMAANIAPKKERGADGGPESNERPQESAVRPEGNDQADGQRARQVGGRRKWKMRGMDIHIAWFEGVGSVSIQEPPTNPPPADVEPYDLFIHRVPLLDEVQVWRWECQDTVLSWKLLTLGKEVMVPGLKRPRILVLTDQGKPSYVTPGTVDRRYNHPVPSDDDSVSPDNKEPQRILRSDLKP